MTPSEIALGTLIHECAHAVVAWREDLHPQRVWVGIAREGAVITSEGTGEFTWLGNLTLIPPDATDEEVAAAHVGRFASPTGPARRTGVAGSVAEIYAEAHIEGRTAWRWYRLDEDDTLPGAFVSMSSSDLLLAGYPDGDVPDDLVEETARVVSEPQVWRAIVRLAALTLATLWADDGDDPDFRAHCLATGHILERIGDLLDAPREPAEVAIPDLPPEGDGLDDLRAEAVALLRRCWV